MSTLALDPVQALGGPGPRVGAAPPFLVVDAGADRRLLSAHAALRRRAFVEEQALFPRHDRDAHDGDPATRVLVAICRDGSVIGGVRMHPAHPDPGLGWWHGSRLVARGARGAPRAHVGAALVRAACATADDLGVLRFDAHVQLRHRSFFARLGWDDAGPVTAHGAPHVVMRRPAARIAGHARGHKAPVGALVAGIVPAGRYRGDDGVPVGDGGTVACVDAITPAMVERDPEWAGWCGALVTAHDLSAMGARPLGLLNAVAAADRVAAGRILSGLADGARAMGLPILGGHIQLGVPAGLSVTGLGHADDPVPGGGMRPGDAVALCADLGGGWRPGYRGHQWDSSSGRAPADMRAMLDAVPRARPRAAKDVSMAGIAGTAGMMAEASGCAVEFDVARIPRPAGVAAGEWLTCFPGFAMLTADRPGTAPPAAPPAASAVCGRAVSGTGVRLAWPDGVVTTVIDGPVTGLGPANEEAGA